MNTKNNPSVYDGHAKAQPDEPMFTLLGRDRVAPLLLALWVNYRRQILEADGAMNTEEEIQLVEVLKLKNDFTHYLMKNNKRPIPYPPMVSAYEDVRAFHAKFGLVDPESPTWLTDEEMGFRVKFMQEELQEFRDAVAAQDMVKAADSLVDLAYVVLGTSARMGLPHDDIHALVHMANMRKQRATSVEQSTRGSTLDVIKPEGWVSPEGDIKELLDLLSTEE